VRENFEAIGEDDIFAQAKVTADSGFHSEENMQMLAEQGIDRYMADKSGHAMETVFHGA
jgi:hypothetical protein